ncbi:MAG: hypothetical protein ACXWKP_20605 [Bradyrhizobium sp.]
MGSSVSERLTALHSQLNGRTIEGEALLAELGSLLSSVTKPNLRDKIAEALGYAEIYFGGRRGLDQWKDPEMVRGFLLQAIHKASMIRS